VALDIELQQDLHANQANLNMLTNSSMPEGLLASDKPISQEQAKQLRTQWESMHKGSARSHRIAVLGYGTQFQKVQLSPKEMEYLRLKTYNRSTILARYGVQPAVVGIKDEYTPLSGKDTGEQMREFWNVTLIPELQSYVDKLRTDFFERLGLDRLGYSGEFDLNAIQELQEDEDKLSTRERQDVKEGITKINEVRARRKQDPVPWGNTWWRPFSVVPAESAINPLAGGPGSAGDDSAVGERNVTPVESLFKTALPPASPYPAAYRVAHWQKVVAKWEALEKGYVERIKAWMFAERSRALTLLAEGWPAKDAYAELMDRIVDEVHWAEASEEFAAMAREFGLKAADLTEEDLSELFSDLGLEIDFSIAATDAITRLEFRVNQIKGVVSETMRSQLRRALEHGIQGARNIEEVADGIREVFNVGRNRARTIARTELGGAYNDCRISGYLFAGFTEHEWLTARDAHVRPTHQIDMERRVIGEPFSNGLLYPNDPSAPAEEVVNCRCVSLPVFQGVFGGGS
jgi:SPP1 gp7 family putative phage head morphogenesis protein